MFVRGQQNHFGNIQNLQRQMRFLLSVTYITLITMTPRWNRQSHVHKKVKCI